MARRLPESTWAEIRTAYASGIGLREIARNMGVPAGTVLARAKREHWTSQIQAAKAQAQTAPSALTVEPVRAVALAMKERGSRHIQRMASTVDRIMETIEKLSGTELLNLIDRVERFDRVSRRTYRLDEDQVDEKVQINVLNVRFD